MGPSPSTTIGFSRLRALRRGRKESIVQTSYTKPKNGVMVPCRFFQKEYLAPDTPARDACCVPD